MKIRCDHDSIRLRLRKSEVETFERDGELSNAVHFPGGQAFVWKINWFADLNDPTAGWHAGELRVALPQKQALRWCQSDEIGIEVFIPLSGAEKLHLLIEKDFPCKDRPEEDQSDFFQDLADKSPVVC